MVEDRGRVRVDGAELYYEVAGEGRTLVLLHDGLLDRRVWDDQFAAFSRLYRTVRYDRRGYGGSSAHGRPFSEASDLCSLLRHQGADEARLLGISNGGKVALEFALEHPGMVTALVLVGPGLGGHRPSDEKRRRVSAILSVARERGFEAGVEAWMDDPFYPPSKQRRAARERVRRIARENLPRLLSAAPSLREEPDPPTAEGLSRIVAPTLILVGGARRPGQPGDRLHLGRSAAPCAEEGLRGLRPPGEPRAAGRVLPRRRGLPGRAGAIRGGVARLSRLVGGRARPRRARKRGSPSGA